MIVPAYFDEKGQAVEVSVNHPFPTSNVVANGSITEEKLSPALDDKINGKVDKAGDLMSGQLDLGSNKVVNVADPTQNQDAATKQYVDSQIAATPSSFNYLGSWNASTNTPALADGSGTVGDLYKVSTAGSQDLGSGSINFAEGDHVVYDGATWENFGAGEAISSVNGQTGVVALDADNVGAVDKTGDTMTGDLHMSEKKVVNLADGSSARDAVNKQQLDAKADSATLPVKRSSGTVSLQLADEELIWPTDVQTGKIRLYNSTPGSDNTFYGIGVQNGVQVYQVDSNTSKHVFQGVDGSDNALPIVEMNVDAGIVAHVEMNMSSNTISNLGNPVNSQDAVTLHTLNNRITEAQRTAIDALTSGSSASAIVAALQAT